MDVSIQNSSKCEFHAGIRFLLSKGETAAEIHRQLVSVNAKMFLTGKSLRNTVVNFKREEVMRKTIRFY